MVSPSIDEMLEKALESWVADEPDLDFDEDSYWEFMSGPGLAKIAKEAAPTINPATAEVTCFYQPAGDPYGVLRYYFGPGEIQDVRTYFARVPEVEVQKPFSRFGTFAARHRYIWRFEQPWVWFGDLPEPVRDALWEKHKLLKEENGNDN
jgi:hypothetical protein